MGTRGLWRWLGALAAPGALLCAVAAGCEPQDIYLFDEVEETPEPDAGDDEVEVEPEPDAGAPAFEQPSCESTACEECVEDGCGVSSESFFCHPVTGLCKLACPETPAGDRPCPGGQHCNTEIGLCVDCVLADDCSGGPLLACDPERGECVECVGPETCTTLGQPYCDVPNRECVGCRNDDDCAATGQVCVDDRCVQCRDNDDCVGFEDDNLCVPGMNVCGECVTGDDCVRIDPTRPFCSPLEHECEDDE